MSKLIAIAIANLALAAAAVIGFAPTASADATGCETVPWGFLGSQSRTICDGEIQANGGWQRARIIWVRAHQVPIRCTTYGGSYSSSTSCTGGYFVDDAIINKEVYLVFPSNVLPDEPDHLVGGLQP